MIYTARAYRGMVVAPHHLAARSGQRVLAEGGTAVEACVAAVAVLGVVYPHMTGMGGDGFWLVSRGGKTPVGVDGCGRAAAGATPALYAEHGLDAMPWRGPLAALTMAGAVSGWKLALELSPGARLPLSRLFEDAVHYARHGYPATQSQCRAARDKRDQLLPVPGYAGAFEPGGAPPAPGSRLARPELADTLEHLARVGLDDFYTGDLARGMAADLGRAGSPLALADFQAHRAGLAQPLCTPVSVGELFNFPPPTQGLASLMILGIFDRLGVAEAEGFAHVHALVEATKQAFLVRDAHVEDPGRMHVDPAAFLAPDRLDALAATLNPREAAPWPAPPQGGDTVWFGAADASGEVVSAIQSVYFEYGSGLVLPQSGVLWQNRGCSFSLAPGRNALAPGRKPFHTLNPAMARLNNGRMAAYGTMGGEGQPQTQAAVLSRYAWFGQELQRAITAPRWLLGRTWGEDETALRIEEGFAPEVVEALAAAGHAVRQAPAFSELMGHAGAVVLHRDGLMEGAADPRGDGQTACF